MTLSPIPFYLGPSSCYSKGEWADREGVLWWSRSASRVLGNKEGSDGVGSRNRNDDRQCLDVDEYHAIGDIVEKDNHASGCEGNRN